MIQLTLLRRLVPRLRARWPGVPIELRADSGFAGPKRYSYCEAEGLGSTIGLAGNARLQALAAPQLAAAQRWHAARAEGDPPVRLVGEGRYQADRWERARRVICKTEILEKGVWCGNLIQRHSGQDQPPALLGPRILERHRPLSTGYARQSSGGQGRRLVIDSGGRSWCAGSCSRIWWRSSSTCSA
jgi:hypothetical protein